MLTFLCRLTPPQWAAVNCVEPDGLYQGPTDWFVASGLYHRDDEPDLLIVQYIGPGALRVWLYEDVFLPSGCQTLMDLEELAARCEELAAQYERGGQADDAERWHVTGQEYLNRAYFPAL